MFLWDTELLATDRATSIVSGRGANSDKVDTEAGQHRESDSEDKHQDDQPRISRLSRHLDGAVVVPSSTVALSSAVVVVRLIFVGNYSAVGLISTLPRVPP